MTDGLKQEGQPSQEEIIAELMGDEKFVTLVNIAHLIHCCQYLVKYGLGSVTPHEPRTNLDAIKEILEQLPEHLKDPNI